MKLFVDELTVIDSSLLDAERGLTGMSWIVDLVLEGELDEQSMVMDFGKVKRMIKDWIDNGPDHRLVVAKDQPGLEIEPHLHGITFQETTMIKFPAEGIYVIDGDRVDTETLCDFVQKELNDWLDEHKIHATLTLREEKIDGPYYCYSHGLKKHDGNCQRIAHGHRSKLKIWRNGEFAEDLVQQWSEEWKDIYVGSKEDITKEDEARIQFAYDAPQGHFCAILPREKCCVIDSDSTVECIAQYIADTLKSREPSADFKVQAYEGVRKGAIAEA